MLVCVTNMQSVNPIFLESPGTPQIQWRPWFDAFETYIGAIGASGYRAERKKFLLLNSLGFEGREVFEHLPDIVLAEGEVVDEYQEAVKKLEIKFDVRPSFVVLRHKFFKRAQLQSENFDTYLSALRQLCAECQFGEHRDQLVRDQFIAHCCDKQIQQKLLTMGNPSLEDTIRVAKSVELAQISIK